MGECLVLDLETQREFSEVEGRAPHLLGVSLVGVYSYEQNRYDAYTEEDIPRLAERLKQVRLVVGFNHRRFDLPVLQPYLSYSVESIPMLDILDDVVKVLGHRLSLDSITKETLGYGKTSDGLQAIRWYREGRIDLIAKYCLNDVKITKEVYDYGRKHGQLYASNKFGTDRIAIPVYWPNRRQPLEKIVQLVREAKEKSLQVEMCYMARPRAGAEAVLTRRCVDVYFVEEPFFEARCCASQEIETFRLDCVVEVKPTWQRFSIPKGFVPTIVALGKRPS